ncbi:hypothetical protein EIQ26_12045 [Xanthomonas campestris pv. incanae]
MLIVCRRKSLRHTVRRTARNSQPRPPLPGPIRSGVMCSAGARYLAARLEFATGTFKLTCPR